MEDLCNPEWRLLDSLCRSALAHYGQHVRVFVAVYSEERKVLIVQLCSRSPVGAMKVGLD